MSSSSLLTISLLSLSVVSPLSTKQNVSPLSYVYQDVADTTSFSDADVLSMNKLEGTQVFGDDDIYDYVKYTAAYTRHVFLDITCNNNKNATIEVYLNSKGLTSPVKTYHANDEIHTYSSVFVKQGDTIYYKIRATGNCLMTYTLIHNFNLTGIAYHNYERFHDYSMPHSGPANIYYSYDKSCNQTVPEQDYTFADVLDEAIEIWEGVGEVKFVKNSFLSTFKVVISSESNATLEVYHTNNSLTPNWFYVSHFFLPYNLGNYAPYYYGRTNADGTPVTVRQAVLSEAVCGWGFVLGIWLSDTVTNIVSDCNTPYCELGSGDIAAYNCLWGDANL